MCTTMSASHHSVCIFTYIDIMKNTIHFISLQFKTLSQLSGVCVRILVCLYVAYMFMCACVNMVYLCVYAHVYVFVCKCVCTYACMCLCV